jgi:hypothetical protein
MESMNRSHKNPSRETCEAIIKRILNAEVEQHGTNTHFKGASDFMNYFESLYPASDALTKQVQRAIKAMNMPKDESGYLVANKTVDQFDQEKRLSRAFSQADIRIDPMDNVETVFLVVPPHMRTYLIHLFETTSAFQNKFLTAVEAANGLLLYTQDKEELIALLNNLTI